MGRGNLITSLGRPLFEQLEPRLTGAEPPRGQDHLGGVDYERQRDEVLRLAR